MHRRTLLKGLFVFGLTAVPSISIYKWFKYNSLPDFELLKQKEKLIAELAEVIIPRTDTPGAKDAQVEDFIINMVIYCTEKKTQNNLIRGLEDLENYTIHTYNKTYFSCTDKEKATILKKYEEQAVFSLNLFTKINKRIFGKPFFTLLKELTVAGYCTSMVGATQGLAYDYVPGSYNGCIPLTPNQRSWATR